MVVSVKVEKDKTIRERIKMKGIYIYRLVIGLATIGLSSFILNSIYWIFEGSYGAKLLIPGFILLLIGSYFMGLYVDYSREFMSNFKKENNINND